MDIKYREKSLWKTAGMLWLGVAFFNLVCLLFFMWMGFSAFTIIVYVIMACNILLSIIIGMYYLRLNDITYIQLESDMLLIHKGLIRLKKKISYQDIEESRISENKLILILTNGKEIKINLNLLKIKDFNQLNIKLSEHIKVKEVQ